MKYVVLTLCFVITISGRAEIIDRIMATVNRHIITLSDLRRERQIRSVLGQNAPADDKSIIKELVDNLIIEDQILLFPRIDVPDDWVETEMKRVGDLHGIPPDIVRDVIRRKLRTSEFFNQRFRQFLQATDQEVRQYYETDFVEAARKRGVTSIPALDEVATQIRNNLIEEKLMHDVDNWLEALRRRSDIEVLN